MSSRPPIVFVHGNPETAVVWDRLGEALRSVTDADQIRLSPPGFGAPVPDGFEPSPRAYRNWLAAELEQIGEPVDLVGHDWGAGAAVALLPGAGHWWMTTGDQQPAVDALTHPWTGADGITRP